jgi:ABC-2 type transport system permease protein
MPAEGTLAHLAWREIRRGALIIVASVIGLVAAFGAAFSAALSPDSGASSINLAPLTSNPAMRALYGVPYAIDTRGGFIVWRGSTVLLLLVSLWAVTTSTRILRGEEDAGRWDLLLAEPLRRASSTAVHLLVLFVVSIVTGAAVAVTMVAGGSAGTGSVLFGSGVGLVMLTFCALGACTSQLFNNRRLAAGVGGAVVGGSFVLRMAADASSGSEWVRWLTPFGWVENLEAFGGDHWAPLNPLVVAPCLLLVVAMVLVHRRDLGEGIIRSSESTHDKTRLLRSPMRFAWRQRLGGLAGWSAGMAFYGLIIGAITATGSKFIASNPELQQMTAQLGLTGLATPAGFIASLAGFLAVALAIYAATSLGRCHEDEGDQRLDLPYSQPVTRSRWLGSQALAAVVTVVVAAIVNIVATYLGGVAGNAGLSLRDVTVATFNVMPAVALFAGITILLLGFLPGLAVSAGAGAAVAAYALTFIGPALKWPAWVLDLSPFQHLGNAPISPVAWTAVVVLLAVSAGLTAIGFVGYQRRDLA